MYKLINNRVFLDKKSNKIHFVTLDLFWRINLILKAKNSCVLGDFISLLEFVFTLSSFWYVAFFHIHICTKKNLSLIVKPRFQSYSFKLSFKHKLLNPQVKSWNPKPIFLWFQLIWVRLYWSIIVMLILIFRNWIFSYSD